MKREASAPPNITGTPFEKFEELTEWLMSVPKKELDAKLAGYERKKKRNKKKPPLL